MFSGYFTSDKFHHFCTRVLNLSVLATLGIMVGIVPQFSRKNYHLAFEYSALANEYTQEEIINYARAGLQIEMLRRRTYQDIKQETNQRPPNIVCNRPETIEGLPQNIRNIANSYCQETINIIRDNNLSVQRFNELKMNYDSGGQFHQQVQQMLIDFQNQQ
ncbi:MAG TPA: DUF4168 domain-containing protein [Xenococcaceae cyanobacterium]|jgi:hypothetical protein